MLAPNVQRMNTVNFQMSLDEHLRTGFQRKIRRPRFLIAIASVFTCGVFLLMSGGMFSYVGVFFMAYAVISPVQLYFGIYRVLTKCRWFTAPTTLTFGESGITVAAPDYRSELGWSQFRSWSQTTGYLFLFLDEGSIAVTVPKRAFNTEQLQAFLRYLVRVRPTRGLSQ
jgi:YcxB-like protein